MSDTYCELVPCGEKMPNRARCKVCWWPHKLKAGEAAETARRVCKEKVKQRREPCVYLGDITGETVDCPGCKGSVKVKVFACSKYEKCTPRKKVGETMCCKFCPDYSTSEE